MTNEQEKIILNAKNCDKARKMAMRQVREGATTSITHSIFK